MQSMIRLAQSRALWAQNLINVTFLNLLPTVQQRFTQKQHQKVMKHLSLKLQQLRQSQQFLSKDKINITQFHLCCCHHQPIQPQEQYASLLTISPSPKISIKKVKKSSHKPLNHTNSQFSISKQSNRSNILSKKPTHSNHYSPSPNLNITNIVKPSSFAHPNYIRFQYSNRPAQNKNMKHNSYIAKEYPRSEPIIQMLPIQVPIRQYKSYTKIPAKPKIIDQNIQNQFKNILDFGDTLREQYSYGQPFQIQNGEDNLKVKSSSNQNMSHFSFGQNQKQQFMSKYLNLKNEISPDKIIISSKSNSKNQQTIKEIIEQKLSKHSKSSKSSGQIFVRGTFNKNTLNSLAKKRDLLYQYKSQSDISLESSQSLVIQTYQSIMKKRQSFIGDYQH